MVRGQTHGGSRERPATDVNQHGQQERARDTMPHTFVDTLKDIREGEVLTEATEALRELVGAVKATGRTGKLQLTLIVKPVAKADANALVISDELKVVTPKAERGHTVFFATDENSLSRNDPRQPELKGLREVTTFPKTAGANQ